MALTTPTAPSPAPTPAIQRGDSATFADRVDAAITYLTAAPAQIAALAVNVFNNATETLANAIRSETAATAATSAAATAGAIAWVSGATYAIGDARYSLLNGKTYRRRTAGAGTTDPSADATNWFDLSATEPGMGFLDKGNSGTTAQTVTYSSAAEIQQLTVTGAFTLSLAGFPATRSAIMRLDLVNGGAFNITWGTTINWEKADGTLTTNFNLSGYTLLSAGKNFVLLWTSTPGGPIYARVV